MGRILPVLFVRRRMDRYRLRLRSTQPSTWSGLLSKARDILHLELGLPPELALAVIVESVTAAHCCALALDQLTTACVNEDILVRAQLACRRISNGINRSAAKLRRELDLRVAPLISNQIIDLETIDSIFNLVKAVVGTREDEPALTILKHLILLNGKAADYLALAMEARSRGKPITLPPNETVKSTTAALFTHFSAVLATRKATTINRTMHRQCKLDYVAQLAAIWSGVGLKPGRVTVEENPQFKGRFLRFADLILTDAIEPWVQRHDGIEKIRHAKKRVDPALVDCPEHKTYRREKRPWLINDGHIKDGRRAAR